MNADQASRFSRAKRGYGLERQEQSKGPTHEIHLPFSAFFCGPDPGDLKHAVPLVPITEYQAEWLYNSGSPVIEATETP